MTKTRIVVLSALLLFVLYCPSCIPAQSPKSIDLKVILDMHAGTEKYIIPSSAQVNVSRSTSASGPGIDITIQPGKEGYPSVNIKPEGAAWNLAAYGHVEARVINTGAHPLSVALRVDNAAQQSDTPWDTENIYLEPGASGTITTIFGYSYGHKPGYALKPNAIVNMVLFTGKADTVQSFRLESLVAGGLAREKPAVAPEDVRVQPVGGVLLGQGVSLKAATQIAARTAQASLIGGGNPSLRILFPASPADSSVSVKPEIGRWNLRDFLEVRVRLRNDGKASLTPRARVESNGGSSDWASTAKPLAPGAEGEITVPFAGATVADLSRPGTGSQVTSDAVSAITLAADNATAERALTVSSIQAGVPISVLPDWLGKRPPVPGNWVKTLDDEFTGSAIDPSLWSVYGENYWDKVSHWSKNNVLIGDGVVKLRYEKKTGFNNDDPTKTKTDYASGYLHTFDKWVQRYGYFEARMKLPTAPGLWPAFWMMPDRGAAVGPQGNRQDTGNGGMEFDIMEHLTRWGGRRYNVAMHYDGYGKDHKSLGSDKIYVHPDKEGFFTCGLLWTPGSVVYYCNGREVLRWANPRISNVPSILMFTLPMGGWDNSPLDASRLPADFVIDYVRVWQRKDLASSVDGKKPGSQAKH